MQVYRVEVHPIQDGNNLNHVEAAQQLGISGLTACQETRLFFVQGELDYADVQRLAAELLADPVTERYHVGVSDTPESAYLIETTLHPGVTDPAAENLVRAAHLIGLHGLERAATGHRYFVRGDLSPEQIHRLAVEVFSNPVIQRYVEGQAIDAPFIETAGADDTVEVVDLRDKDDQGLMAISQERRLSLDINEMKAIRDYYQEIDRDPTDAELEMLAQTWSEHCVHKTFKANITYTGPAHGASPDTPPTEQKINGILKTYLRAATEKVNKPWVRSAFVDNAGIIKFDEIWDIAFKVETHNRPSAIEPFGGANTGSGGVIRDVLGVSARPIANTDILCFGMPDTPHESLPEGVLHPLRIADGVVAGIEDYGNKMGIPTVNGAIVYHKGYTSNPLVFAGCLGILPHGVHRTQANAGDLVVVIGGRTGRDGLRGATFSSMEMDTTTAQVSGGAVQIGHPINEKQVQEVVLRARDEELYTAITDCGAGGLSSAVGEMGADLGVRVQLQDIPLKYPGLRPWEIWLSEAQERMVLAIPPENWERFKHICEGQDVEATVIGTFEDSGHLHLYYGEKLVGDLSMHFLHDGIPTRNMTAQWMPPMMDDPELPSNENYGETLLKLLAMPTIRSKEDVIRRYDHEVQTGTAVKPLVGIDAAGPGDATVLVPMDTIRALTPKSPLPLWERGLQNIEGTSNSQGERGLQNIEETSNSQEEKGLQNAHVEDISELTTSHSGDEVRTKLAISPALRAKMVEVARRLRRDETPSEEILWDAIRVRKLEGRKFRRQQPVGPFVLDFYCASENLAVEVDGSVHATQLEDDAIRQELLESVGIRFVRVTAAQVETQLDTVLNTIRAAFKETTSDTMLTSPSPLVGEGDRGGEGPIKAVALSNGVCPTYTDLDPYAMAWAAVDEAMRNLVAVGADPDQVAILDNFSWGNTQMPDRLGSLVRCSQGCYDAALAYSVPYISGKDSLNNEYLGEDGQRHAIPGTLVISAVGIVPDVDKTITMDLKTSGNLLYVIGETRDELGGSHYFIAHGLEGGTVPQPIPDALNTLRKLYGAIQAGTVTACHDVSEGGIAVALAEMALAGRRGAAIDVKKINESLQSEVVNLFSESIGRFIVEIPADRADDFTQHMDGVYVREIGRVTEENTLQFDGVNLSLTELETAFRGHIPQPEKTELPTNTGTGTSSKRIATAHTAKPRVLILHANGTNRDRDAMLACELAGGEPEIVHINQLIGGERHLLDYHMLVIPGGFSYGDDLGAGVLWALDLRERISDIDQFVAEGRPVMGICNGFQTLVKSGLLPGANWTQGSRRSVTLTYNERGEFECRWVYLQPNPHSVSLFTEGLTELIHCPIAHGEGRVMVKDEATLQRIVDDGLIALTYVDADGSPAGYPVNPNGSVYGIAGLSNPEGNVFGLMPHPENHIFPWQNPRKHRGVEGMSGLALFKNGIRFA